MKFRLLTAVWGAEFCDLFARVAARSLLAAGNFPDLSRRHPTVYSILTIERDAEQIRSSAAFAALAASGQVELQAIPAEEIDPANPSSHWIIWRKGIELAKSHGEFVIYIMPDILYASGTLLDWAAAFEQGYRALFTSIPEVVLETTLRELEEGFPAERGAALNLDVRQVTDLCLKHLHPYHLCMLRDGSRWVPHPETVGYIIPGTAFVQRVIGSHPICFDPQFFEFNHAYVPLNRFESIAVVPNSAISLEPFLKFMALYYRPWRMVGERLSNFGWWVDYFTGPANDVESRRSYVFPLPGRTSRAAVARAHARGDFYRSQCLAARAIFRVWTKVVALGCDRAAELLAAAHYAGRLRRHRLLPAPMTVLVPSNEALDRAAPDFVHASEDERRRRLLQLVYGHCFPGRHELAIGQQIVATSGGQIRAPAGVVSDRAHAAGKIVSGPVELDGIILYGTDFVAKPRAAPARRERSRSREARHSSGVAASERERILINRGLASAETDGPPLPVRLPPEDHACRADNRALAGTLRRLVAEAARAQGDPDPGVPGRAVTAQFPMLARLSKLLPDLRGALRLRVYAAPAVPPKPPENARMERIRELVLADDRAEADGVIADSAQVWRELAGELGGNGKVEAGLYCRRRAALSEPDNPQLRLEWMRDLLLAGRFDEAKLAGGGDMQLWRILGGGFHAEGRPELQLYCRRRAVEASPADLQVRQELLRDLLVAGLFEEANSEDGRLVQAWCLLGNGFFFEGQGELGLYCRHRAADLDPSDIQLRKELVRELMLAERVEEATAAADGLRQLWRELAAEFGAQGREDLQRRCRDLLATAGGAARGRSAAERAFRAIQIEIGVSALRELLRGYTEELGGNRVAAPSASPAPLECLDEFLAASKRRLDPLNRLAQLLEQEPDFADAWLEKAMLHYEAGQVVPAVEAALRALRARPRCLREGHNPHPHAEAAALVASCLETAGAWDEAIAAYRRCLAIHQAQPVVRARLGRVLWRRGLVKDATAEFAKAMAGTVEVANLPDLPRRIEKLSLE